MKVSTCPRINTYVAALVRQGYSVKRGSRGHPKLVTPSGARLAIPGTPSDPRAGLNWIKQARQWIEAGARRV